RLGNPANATIAEGEGEGTIIDNESPPILTINNVTVDEGAGTAVFTVTLSNASASEVGVDYVSSDGTAVAGEDYTTASDRLTVTAGSLTGNVIVPINNDTLDENSETYTITLSNPANATIADGEGIGTITDNDPTPTLSIDDETVNETGGTATFTVTLSAASTFDVAVDYATRDGTATAPDDYSAIATQTMNISAGDTTGNVVVTINDDGLNEGLESFYVRLGSPINATIGDGEGEGTIIDDDGPPALSINDVTVDETDGTAVFEITLSKVGGADVDVNYATGDGTATAGSDYEARSGTASIPMGDISTTVAINISDDALDEMDETFTVTLSSPVNAILADAEGLGTIVDDDASPVAVDDVYTTAEDTVLTVAASGVLTNDTDLDGDTLAAVLDAGPSNGTLALNADGSFTYTPTLNFDGTDSFSYHASDGFNDSNVATVAITVTAVNDPPGVVNPGQQTSVEEATVSLQIQASDPENDTLAYSATGLPPGLSINPATGEISGTIPQGALGTYSVTVQVTDSQLPASVMFYWVVREDTFRIYMPLMMRNYEVPVLAPDLVVVDVTATTDNVQVVIRNDGDAPVEATDEFWIEVYIDPDYAPTAVNQLWYELCEDGCDEGMFWGVYSTTLPMNPGQAITLTYGDASYAPSISEFGESLAPGTPVYAQVDAYDESTTYGAVLEKHEISGGEYNNIAGPFYSTASVSATDVSLTEQFLGNVRAALSASNLPFVPEPDF
ncbi:MAG: hypothetical protein GY832_37835, partial [Chloroflexi bacterium]|nr:hypothetical protein [Chloroflexota bacterium]